jgi:hypothetical protein
MQELVVFGHVLHCSRSLHVVSPLSSIADGHARVHVSRLLLVLEQCLTPHPVLTDCRICLPVVLYASLRIRKQGLTHEQLVQFLSMET